MTVPENIPALAREGLKVAEIASRLGIRYRENRGQTTALTRRSGPSSIGGPARSQADVLAICEKGSQEGRQRQRMTPRRQSRTTSRRAACSVSRMSSSFYSTRNARL